MVLASHKSKYTNAKDYAVDDFSIYADHDRTQVDEAAKGEYKSYLEDSVNLLARQLETQGKEPLTVTTDDVLSECPIWVVPGFVWPFVLHNHDGGVVLRWDVNGATLRLERLDNGRWTVFVHEKGKLEDPYIFNSDEEALTFVEGFYLGLVDAVAKSEVDWKKKLVSEVKKASI